MTDIKIRSLWLGYALRQQHGFNRKEVLDFVRIMRLEGEAEMLISDLPLRSGLANDRMDIDETQREHEAGLRSEAAKRRELSRQIANRNGWNFVEVRGERRLFCGTKWIKWQH